MSSRPGDYRDYQDALERAAEHVRRWLRELPERPVRPLTTSDDAAQRFAGPLPEAGLPAADVVDHLAEQAEPGVMPIQSGRFFGWVMGGSLPAALAADWLLSGWDQNGAMRLVTPAVAAIEQAAGEWIVDLLGLPAGSDVGFTTGATMANMAGLAAGRFQLLHAQGWDVNADGLHGAPPLPLIAGGERHASLDMAARFLGLGRPELVPCDTEGRLVIGALKEALARHSEPVIVCLQAGNVHSGSFDPFPEAVTLTKDHGGWVHVDGAFGLWAAAVPELRSLVEGVADADSWATDAHKTLNVGYDCGVVICRDPEALRSALGAQAEYLIKSQSHGPGDPMDKVPEMSRRARGVPVWAALRSLGRQGTIELVAGRAATASRLAELLAALPGVEVLNEVVYTQLALSFGDDERTRAVAEYIMADDRSWMSGSRWRGRDILRISVTNWATDDDDLAVVVDVVRDAIAATRSAESGPTTRSRLS